MSSVDRIGEADPDVSQQDQTWLGYLLTFVARHVFHRLSSLLVLILVSIFLTLAIEPGVNWLARRGWRRGTATLSTEWVKAGKDRTAYGVDLDRPTLDWGREHNIGSLNVVDAQRIELVEANVLTARGPKADLTAALNFSYCCFKERKQLLERVLEAAPMAAGRLKPIASNSHDWSNRSLWVMSNCSQTHRRWLPMSAEKTTSSGACAFSA